MKRRNADSGKLRRPLKRTKITEGTYGNSMLYIKFVLLWSSIALADYMLEFRFEFLGPLWLMIKAIYYCYYSKGLALTVLFACVALTSDVVCYFIIPTQVLTFLAGVYVWVNSIWNTFESKGICTQTLCMWLVAVYVEALRTGFLTSAMRGALPDEPADWGAKPWAAGALGFPIISLGVNAKQMLDAKLRLRTQRRVRAQNEFYFKLMREALPEDGLSNDLSEEIDGLPAEPTKNGSVKSKRPHKPDTNGHCVRDKEHAILQTKLEHLDQYIEKRARGRDSSTQSTQSQKSTQSQRSQTNSHLHSCPHAYTNGTAKVMEDDKNCKGAKSSKYDKKETAPKEDKKRKKHKDLDKESVDSHKSTDNVKEQIVKDVESTNDCAKVKECNNVHASRTEEKRRDEERKREKEEERKREEEKRREKEEERKREREEEKKREKERERELKEREKERERELMSARSCAAELAAVKAALAAAQRSEADCARQLAACLAADLQRQERLDTRAQLQHKMSTWRCSERAALERKLGEERRLRIAADQQLQKARRTSQSECSSSQCVARRGAADAELGALRRDVARLRDALQRAHADLSQANEKVSALEAEKAQAGSLLGGGGAAALEARAAHLERVLSAETRLKLDLLAALGDANRKMRIHESVINRQEKELEELKAQMLAVMPAELAPRGAPLDPNASVYTPRQLCSDA